MYKNILYGIFFTIVIIFLSFLYIFWKYIPLNFKQLFYILQKKYLLLSIFSLFCFHTFDNLRVFLVSRSLGINYSFLYGYVISLINTFGATVTPAHLGGEMLPFYTLKRIGAETFKIMSVITIKAISGAVFFVLFFPLTVKHLIKNPKEALEFLIVAGSIIILFGLFYLIFLIFVDRKAKTYRNWVTKIKFTFLRYFVVCREFFKNKKMIFLVTVFVSLLMYVSFIGIGFFLVMAFNGNVEGLKAFVFQLPLVYAIFISPTPGGSGVGEIGALVVFEKFICLELLGFFAIFWRLLTQYISAFLGGVLFVYLTFKDLILKKNQTKMSV